MIKQIDDDLYRVISLWWKDHGFPSIQKEYIGDRGYVSFIDGNPIFFGSIYCSGPIGFITFMTNNPNASLRDKEAGFNLLIAHLEEIAKLSGVRALIAESNNKRLCERFVNYGFDSKDQNIVHLLKGI